MDLPRLHKVSPLGNLRALCLLHRQTKTSHVLLEGTTKNENVGLVVHPATLLRTARLKETNT